MFKIKTASVRANLSDDQRLVVRSAFDAEGELRYYISTCGQDSYGDVCIDEDVPPEDFAAILDCLLYVWEHTEL